MHILLILLSLQVLILVGGYSYAILQVRALRTGRVWGQWKWNTVHAQSGQSQSCQLQVHNASSLLFRRSTLRCLFNPLLSSRVEDLSIYLPPMHRLDLDIEIQFLKSGEAAIWGIYWEGLDLTGCFKFADYLLLLDKIWVHPTLQSSERAEIVKWRKNRHLKNTSHFEIDAIRPYRAGDSIRHIAWKSSAKRQTLLSREHVYDSFQQACVLLDVSESMRGLDGYSLERPLSLLHAFWGYQESLQVSFCAYDDKVLATLPPLAVPAYRRTLQELLPQLQNYYHWEYLDISPQGLGDMIAQFLLRYHKLEFYDAQKHLLYDKLVPYCAIIYPPPHDPLLSFARDLALSLRYRSPMSAQDGLGEALHSVSSRALKSMQSFVIVSHFAQRILSEDTLMRMRQLRKQGISFSLFSYALTGDSHKATWIHRQQKNFLRLSQLGFNVHILQP